MSFNVSAMEAYVSQNAKEIATKAVTEAKTIKLLIDNKAVQFGKGTQTVATMTQTVTFSDGTACGRTEDSDVVLSTRKITFVPMKTDKSFCMKELYGKVLVELISKGQSAESLDSSVYGAIAEDRAKTIAYELEKLVWKGDTTLTGTNLVWFDGFAKIITASGSSITPTGSDVIAKLQSIASQININEKAADDFRIFMGKDVYDSVKLALYNKNMFNPGAELTVPGTDVKIEVATGLNGVSTKVYASRISNLRAILDETGEETNVIMKQDIVNDKALMDFKFGCGVQVVFPTLTYFATI